MRRNGFLYNGIAVIRNCRIDATRVGLFLYKDTVPPLALFFGKLHILSTSFRQTVNALMQLSRDGRNWDRCLGAILAFVWLLNEIDDRCDDTGEDNEDKERYPHPFFTTASRHASAFT